MAFLITPADVESDGGATFESVGSVEGIRSFASGVAGVSCEGGGGWMGFFSSESFGRDEDGVLVASGEDMEQWGGGEKSGRRKRNSRQREAGGGGIY